MNPTTGSPKNVGGVADVAPVDRFVEVPEAARIPVVVAAVLVNDNVAQPFWKELATLMAVVLTEPNTPDVDPEGT